MYMAAVKILFLSCVLVQISGRMEGKCNYSCYQLLRLRSLVPRI